MKVLLVEDNPLTLLSLEHLLTASGIVVWKTATALSAVDALTVLGFKPDVAVIDVRLGSGDTGISLLERLRSWEIGRSLPAILMTAGELTKSDLKRIELCGGVRVLTKPFEFDELLRLVKTSVP